MPIREYRCANCRTEFEELVFGNALAACPACGGHDVQPLMSRCCILGGGDDFSPPSDSGSGSGCGGCSGGNCASCH